MKKADDAGGDKVAAPDLQRRWPLHPSLAGYAIGFGDIENYGSTIPADFLKFTSMGVNAESPTFS